MLKNEPTRWVCLGLILLVALVYGRVAWHEFVSLDDAKYVYENQHVLQGLSAEGVWWAFTSWRAGHWHPLTWLSLMLDAQVYGQKAGGFHLTNLLFHAANVLLLLAVLLRMTGALWPSALVAALFAVHPLHVESVAWVTERKDVLSATFWMLTLLAYTAYVRHGGLPRYLLVALLLALGLMAKPMLVTLPCVLLLLDFWPLGRLRFPFGQTSPTSRNSLTSPTGSSSQAPSWQAGIVLLEKLPLLALSVASSMMVLLSQRGAGALGTLEDMPFSVRLVNALVSYVVYLGKMIWPTKLACFYPHPWTRSHDLSASLVAASIAAVLLLAIITCVVFCFARRGPFLAVGWFWYLGTLVPVIGLVQVGSQSMADRFIYVPLIGIYVMIAWSAADLMRRWSAGGFFATGTCLLVLGALTAAAWFQVGTWRNNRSLYDHAIRATTHNFLAHNNRGDMYRRLGERKLAMADFDRAIELLPDYLDAYYNRGLTYQELGRFKLALDNYDRVIQLNPDFLDTYSKRGLMHAQLGQYKLSLADFNRAIELNPFDAHAYCYRGVAYAELGQTDLALVDYAQAIGLKSDFAIAYYSRGRAYMRLRQLDRALTDYNKTIELQSDYPGAFSSRGIVHVQLGQYKLALSDFNRAIELNPENPQAHNNLARLLATCPDSKFRNGKQAVAAARRACELSRWTDFNTLDTLAAAYAQAGRFIQAVEWQTKALDLAPAGAKNELRRRLQRYKERVASSG